MCPRLLAHEGHDAGGADEQALRMLLGPHGVLSVGCTKKQSSLRNIRTSKLWGTQTGAGWGPRPAIALKEVGALRNIVMFL